MVKSIVSLCILSGCCGLLLVSVAAFTEGAIAANRLQAERALLAEMHPPATDWLAEQTWQQNQLGSCELGLFVRTRVFGYGGEIELLVFHTNNHRLITRTLAHQETPGIGDFIDHQRDPWLPARDGLSAQQWLKVDTVSGATITTQAVQKGVQSAVQTYRSRCDE